MLIWVQRYNIFLYKGRKVVRYFLYRGNFSQKPSPYKGNFLQTPPKNEDSKILDIPLYALCSRKGAGD